MPLNWNDEHIPSKADKTTDILGLKKIGGVGQLVYHPFRFKDYTYSFNGKDQLVYPVCKPGQEPEFPSCEGLTGKELLISLCNLAKVIDSNDNKVPKEQLILKWCKENMHPYRVDFIYAELSQGFDINSVEADLVERDGIFEIDRFMKDLGNLYNAVRFYVALEGLIYSDDEIAYNLYEEGRYFESYNYFEKYKHAEPDIPDEVLKRIETSSNNIVETMQRAKEYIDKHPAPQPPEGEFDFNHNPYDDYDELRTRLVEFIPDFNMRLKFNSATGRFEFSADINSVFDIAWYTLARMISEDPALENRQREETRPEGIMICCRHCGKFLIRRSNRQEFCDSEECQRARNARKQMAYRKRKAGNASEKKRKQRKTKE